MNSIDFLNLLLGLAIVIALWEFTNAKSYSRTINALIGVLAGSCLFFSIFITYFFDDNYPNFQSAFTSIMDTSGAILMLQLTIFASMFSRLGNH